MSYHRQYRITITYLAGPYPGGPYHADMETIDAVIDVSSFVPIIGPGAHDGAGMWRYILKTLDIEMNRVVAASTIEEIS